MSKAVRKLKTEVCRTYFFTLLEVIASLLLFSVTAACSSSVHPEFIHSGSFFRTEWNMDGVFKSTGSSTTSKRELRAGRTGAKRDPLLRKNMVLYGQTVFRV